MSKAILGEFGKKLRVEGLPFLSPGEALETSAASLTATILCRRHNEALSPLDQEAKIFFTQLRDGGHDLDRKSLSRKPTFHLASGQMIELWMLKVACGLFHSVGAANDRQLLRTISDVDLGKATRALFENRWDDRAGMYFMGDTGQSFVMSPDIMLAPLLEDRTNRFCGVQMSLLGYMFSLLFDDQALSAWPWPGYIRRPSELVLSGNRRSHHFLMSWPAGYPDIIVNMHRRKGRPPPDARPPR
ncbi:hypothetical protein RX327_24300 [Bradyrhizobium sp. BEA-2-5]|uniref:hypothetical protein n=1 Tax=Bradyrhizobium sp. BEA-2-5 TaxID=3080015 RepID=UPI00293ED1C2|nr:hypothetical protein [Bradyrhizobium sp. BEA-2-5]WOH79026.1 hypothetical protein RX327_24300 [Bradyrhizobium sp. BEA-2-5]